MHLTLAATTLLGAVAGHGMLVNPRPRNSIDYLANVNDKNNKCTNITGADCKNGQSAFWYAQQHCSPPRTSSLPTPYVAASQVLAGVLHRVPNL
jgi:hypothetical protein